MKLHRAIHAVTLDLRDIERGIASIYGLGTKSEKATLTAVAEGNAELAVVIEAVIRAKDPAGRW